MNIKIFVNDFLSGLDPRQMEVVKARYGLNGGEAETLQAIGDRYGITRERVRQIEASALALLRKKSNHQFFKSFVDGAVAHLKGVGGVAREDSFLAALMKLNRHSGQSSDFDGAARFVLELSGKLLSHRDNYNPNWHHFWYLSEADKRKAGVFLAKLENTLSKRKAEVIGGKKFDSVFRETAQLVKVAEPVAKSYLAISKKFGTGPFNEFGPLSWAEVNPKTSRDWAYLILKKERRPIHFSELSEIISKHRKDKRTNLQTVHNELIKDDRFVLVGRGLYALREHGFIPGTAKEIIAHLLKSKGPMRSREVVNAVMEQRSFKEGTILINLQNRKHFQALPDGRYYTREA